MAAPKRSNHSGTASHSAVAALSFTTKLPAQADFKKVLLERYQEAIARSRKIGHRVSFRVEVDPTAGALTVTPVEEQPIALDDTFPAEDTGMPDADLEAALAGARAWPQACRRNCRRQGHAERGCLCQAARHVARDGQCQAAKRTGARDRWRQAGLPLSCLATRQGGSSLRRIAGVACHVGPQCLGRLSVSGVAPWRPRWPDRPSSPSTRR